MPLWRVRTEVAERPGRLAALAAALAGKNGNILGLSAQVDAKGTVDEFIVEVPLRLRREELVNALCAAGGRRVTAVPASPHELVDETTRALLLAARLRANPRNLPEILAELLRADDARWVFGAAAAAATVEDSGQVMVVPVGQLRGVRLRRAGLAFTLTEATRADALVRSVLPPTGPLPAASRIRLPDGAVVIARPLQPGDSRGVRDLHARCSATTRRMRYFTALPDLTARMLDVFLDRARGLTLAVESAEQRLVGLGHLMYTPDPGVGELALLIEDDWQGRGLGTQLALRLVALAKDRGLAELRAHLLVDNAPMRRLLTGLGAGFRREEGQELVEARLPVISTIQGAA